VILERSREFTVNMGNYESMKTGAKVSVDTDSAEFKVLVATYPDLSNSNDILEALLDAALKQDLTELGELTHTNNSFILTWNDERKNK